MISHTINLTVKQHLCKTAYLSSVFNGIVSLLWINTALAVDGDWQSHGTVQTYLQSYGGSTVRNNAFHLGYYFTSDYLDSGNIGVGYNYTLINLVDSADITEQLFYLSGRHSIYPDGLPGKLTYRLDGYAGKDTLRVKTSTIVSTGSGMGGGGTTRVTTTSTEDTDINAIQPIISFIDFNKTFYADIGYARSQYNSNTDTIIAQLTPTIGFGWNGSYDWVQTRAYLIRVDEDITTAQTPTFKDDRFRSIELKYTHWFIDGITPRLESYTVSLLLGDRVFAVDPDAGSIYSTANRQTGGISANLQWQYSQALSFMTLASFSRYTNDAAADDYSGFLLYFNLQHQW